MATAGDGSAESGGAGEKFRKRIFSSEITGEPHNDSQEACRNNSIRVSEVSAHEGGKSASIAATAGIPIPMLKQMTFTRSETRRLIAVLHSRTIEESPFEMDGAKTPSPTSPSPLLRLEASTSGSLKKHKLEDKRDNFHAALVSSRVLAEQIASPAELAKAYSIHTGQAPRQDLKLINNNNATCLPRTPQHPTTMGNLPDELLSNIFIRLSAKQLAQMRSVSKSWNALLYQSSFIKSHLDHSIHYNDQILLVFYFEESSNFKPFTAHPCRSPHLELINFIKLPPVDPQSECNRFSVIGAVNGLICSSYGNSVIHIWNPSLSAVLTLPPYAMPSYYDTIKIHFRFGFDPKTDDYKVVKLTGLIEPSTGDVKWWLHIEVYSMKKGSWELITSRFPSHITHIINEDRVCVDGHDGRFHWLGLIGEKMDSETIVAFDLGSETFREIPLPVQTVDPFVMARTDVIGVLGEKLCVMSVVGGDGSIEVWVMDEYGVAESWVKRHVFSQFDDDVYPYSFGFTLRNELLVEVNDELVLYDPIIDKAKIFEKYRYVGTEKIVEYVDSLVWVTPTEHA